MQGIKWVEVSQKNGSAEIEYSNTISDDAIARAVNEAGYSLGTSGKLHWVSRDAGEWFEIMLGVSVVLFLWMCAITTGIFDMVGIKFSAAPTYPIVFIIGLTAGISTCMAVVGGLVAGFSASYAEKHQYASRWERFKPNLFFGAGRLVSYALLGGVIAMLGSVIKPSTGFAGFLVVGAGVVMLIIGLKLTGISPKLANLSFTFPKKLSHVLGIKNQNSEYSHKEACIGGALTFFLPCAFTQAMQLYVITTGSFVMGASIMGIFALGTMPGLLGVGALTSFLRGRTARIFFRFIGVVVLVLGVFNIANGLNLSGWGISSYSFITTNSSPAALPEIQNGEQIVHMTQGASGYQPNNITVKKGIPVKWIINSTNAYTCAASIQLPAYNIAQLLQPGQNVIMFTPTQVGKLRFTCSMGMYSGTFTVVE